jgi:hypothetical protein
MVRRISNPMPIFADISQRCVIRYEAHVFPSRANSLDKPLPLISEDEVVMADRYEDGWFHILGANVPNGQGWIHDSYIGCN